MSIHKIVSRKIGAVKRWPSNPRKNAAAVEPVKTSIQEFGFVQPIVIDRAGFIIIGHTRYDAAVLLGMKYVPVIIVDFDEEKARRLRIADNATGEIAEWDFALLMGEMEALPEHGKDLAGFMSADLLAELEKLAAPVTEAPPAKTSDASFTSTGKKHLVKVKCPCPCGHIFEVDRRTFPDV